MAADRAQARQLVERAVTAAVSPDDLTDRPAFPGATTMYPTPTPMAGFLAAQEVTRLAQEQVYKYARHLRAEGVSWGELADLMEIGWSDDYARAERAFELVAGPESGASSWSGPRVYWRCGGPVGCGQSITDRGPYNGYPRDDEDGHADDCQRLQAEITAYERERDEQDRRATVMEEAYGQLPEGFARDTANRARWVLAHGGQYRGWSTSESVAVALVLNDPKTLEAHGYPKRRDAILRVLSSLTNPPADPNAWLALIRAAATGETSPKKRKAGGTA